MAVDKDIRRMQEEQRGRELDSVPKPPLASEFLDAMSHEEMKSVILELFDKVRGMDARMAEKDRALEEKDRVIASLSGKLDTVLENQRQSQLDIRTWLAKEQQWLKEKEQFLKTISDLNDLVNVLKKAKFARTTQKSKRNKKDDNNTDGGSSANETANDLSAMKPDFDGNDPDGKIAAAADSNVTDTSQSTEKQDGKEEKKEKEPRPYRRGLTYNRMSAHITESHASSLENMPEGAEFVKFKTAYSYDQTVLVKEHQYQVVVFKLNGRLYEAYIPAEGEPEYIDKVPGTKATSEFMAYLTYDRFHLHTPIYREVQRLLDEGMSVCRQTLANWLYMVSVPASKVVNHLLDCALCDDAVVNVDETWTRVRDEKDNTYRKKYTWCLVNKRERIVIYHYDNGSRGRKVLKELIGDHHIRALQSDGYNVYLYLDNELVDIEHLCCMAHARAKFKYAADQGDPEAQYFLDLIGELYGLEKIYRDMGLEPDDIKTARNNGRTSQILGDMYNRLVHLRKDGHPPRSELMEKALNYMFTYWKPLTAWRKEGRYDIDNTLAEQYIRPLAGERKNSLFFGSQKMAVVSATFHTLMATCHARGISRLWYLKEFFHGLVIGRTDYDNMIPSTVNVC